MKGSSRRHRRLHQWLCFGALALAGSVGCQQTDSGQATPELVTRALAEGNYAEAERRATASVARVERERGTDSLAAAQALDLLVEASVKNGHAGLSKVQELAERAVRSKERHIGKDDTETASSLHNLGTVYLQRGEFPAALTALERSLTIRGARLGPDAPAVADSLDQLGLTLIRLDRFTDAEQRLAESRRIRERYADQSPLTLAHTLELVSVLYRYTDNYSGAIPLVDRALEIQRRTAPRHPDAILGLQTRGDVLLLTGDNAGALKNWQAALDLGMQALRPDHPTIAEVLRRLGLVAFASGDLAEARRLAERARDIGERSLGPCNPEAVGFAIAVGLSLEYDGEYAEARQLYRESLSRMRQCVDKGVTRATADVEATLVFNDAGVARELGDLAEADALYARAVDIWSNGFGSDHSFVARGLDALAEVAAARGEQTRAHTIYERALAIRRRSLGPHHPQVAWTLANLARTEAEMGHVSRALRYVEEAIAIYQKSGAPDEPDHFARVIELKGRLEQRRGNLQAAHQSLEQAVAERTRIFGANHPLVAETRAALAAVDLARGDRIAALTSALEAERLGREHLLFTVRYLPERQALTYAAARPRGLDLALSIAAGASTDADPVFDAVIRSRGVILDEFAAARRRASRNTDPEVTTLVAAAAATRQRFANLVVRSLQEPVSRRLLDDARTQKDEAERRLAARNVEARAELARVSAGLEDVRRGLPARAALVSFVRYERTNTNRPSVLEPSYAAFIVAPGSTRVAMVSLGPAAVIDPIIKAWRREASGAAMARGESPAAAERSYRTASVRLRRAVWDPLALHVAGAPRVFVVPDGLLNLVNLTALPDGGGYLAERDTVFHYLTTERDLLSPVGQGSSGTGLLTVGGPAFDEGFAPTATLQARRGSDCESLARVHFDNLPGSLSEVAEIGNLWPRDTLSEVTLLSGPAATETAVKQAVTGRRVVHLATHGFVLGTDCGPTPDGTRAVGGLALSSPTETAAAAENPLLRTGLALAGANRRTGVALDQDEGILTAEEIAGLNLQGTEWAVLSACDTGLGEIRAGEGVFGLRRAFQIAGARTVIMSLWPVEDGSTRDWMRALYQGRLQRKLDTAAAVREAGLSVLQARRARGESTHPFYWAAFVAAGDWR